MAIFFQHVGEKGGLRDFPKTIGSVTDGLKFFQLGDVPEIIKGSHKADIQQIQSRIRAEAPNGFQLWGIPSGAKSVLANLRNDDWLLLLMSDRPGGQFYYGGRVVYRPKVEMFGLSQRLWGEARFPLIVVLTGQMTNYSWDRFRVSFAYAENWRLSGNTYRLTPERISRSQYANESEVIQAIVGPNVLVDHKNENFDTIFPELLDQIELQYTSIEGRKRLREHLIAERDPALIRKFKAKLSNFKCAVCDFDFEKIYGRIGRGYIEAHHVEAIGLREGESETDIRDLVAVCSNCHRMLHRKMPPFTIEELREMLIAEFSK